MLAVPLLASCAQRRQTSGIVKRDVTTPQSADTETARARDPLSELLPRIDAITGRQIALIVPMSVLKSSKQSRGRSGFAVLLDDGTKLRYRAFELTISEQGADNSSDTKSGTRTHANDDMDVARLARWLGPQWDWSVTEVDPSSPQFSQTKSTPQTTDETRAALLVIEAPLAASSPALWIGNSRVPVQWLPTATTMLATSPQLAPSLASPDGVNPWEPTLPVRASGSPVTRAMLSHEASSPLTRWRVRLVLDGLSPMPLDAALDAETSGEQLPKFADESLELLASQYEERWQVALGKLHLQDKDLARTLRQRLGAMVMVDNRLPVPAWEQDLATLEQLLDDLLNPDLTPKRRADFARAFLKEQPQGAAWITDDGGLLVKHESDQERSNADVQARRPWATIALANCTNEPTTGIITTRDPEAPASEPVTIAPHSVIRLTTPLLSLGQDMLNLGAAGRAVGLAGAGDLDVSIGSWSTRLAILDGPIPAQPPGLATGPFQPDMSMREWLAGSATEGAQRWATAALLQRIANPQPGDLPHRAWELFIECKTGATTNASDASDDAIYLYAGSPGAPTAAWRITRDGSITSLRKSEQLAKAELAAVSDAQLDRAKVEAFPDRWTARVTLPPGSIEEDGLLRLGLSRIDPRGVRSSWPRALTPWQVEPSRAAVDTTKW